MNINLQILIRPINWNSQICSRHKNWQFSFVSIIYFRKCGSWTYMSSMKGLNYIFKFVDCWLLIR